MPYRKVNQMKRIDRFKKQLQSAKTDAELRTAIIILLMSYSKNVISHMKNNSKMIKEWLEDDTE